MHRRDHDLVFHRLGLCGTLLLGVMALCAGCGRGPGIRALSDSSVVLAFGDSLTAGTGAGREESYPAVLGGLLGCRVVNAGVSGEDTTSGLRRLPAVLKSAKPDLVILCHGGNDMLRRQNREVTIANLAAMIALAKESGADVILIGVPSPGLLLRPAPFYRELAAAAGIPCQADVLAKILSTPSRKSDQAHPNADGYRQLAESIAKVIRDHTR